MTTRETIKKLLVAYRKQCCVIGFLANQKDFNSETFKALLEARDEIDEVINSLCDELPDHFADPGKKGATLPDGTPINLCGGGK